MSESSRWLFPIPRLNAFSGLDSTKNYVMDMDRESPDFCCFFRLFKQKKNEKVRLASFDEVKIVISMVNETRVGRGFINSPYLFSKLLAYGICHGIYSKKEHEEDAVKNAMRFSRAMSKAMEGDAPTKT